MNRSPRILAVPTTLVVLALALPAAADAATVKLSCAGKGARSVDSAGAIHCAGDPKRGRTIAGTVRDDAGRPVAARLTVTFSSWTPRGTGYTVKPTSTREIVAKANGAFSIKRNPKTRESVRVDVVPDPAIGVGTAAGAEAEISRRLKTTLTKLGGGRIRIVVKGTTVRPITVYVLDPSGYAVTGVKPRKVDRKGRATFDLGSRRGRFAYFVSSGVYSDLFWYGGRPKFRL